MSKTVFTDWKCPACETINQAKILKPTVITPTIRPKTCKACLSSFLIEFKKVPYQFKVKWTIIDYTLSPMGQKKVDDRVENKNKQKPADKSAN